MKIPRRVYFLISLVAISCQPLAKSGEEASAIEGNAESKNETITVTIDGREATPEEKEAFGALGKKLLSDAIVKSVNDGVKEVLKKLDITDQIEAELFSVSFGPETSTRDELWSVYLIRAGNEIKEPRTTSILRDGKPIVRFTRATAPVERPIAVMNMTGTKDGRLTQADMFLVYGNDGKWKQYRPSERKENLRGEQER
jgi:hypothetical protein